MPAFIATVHIIVETNNEAEACDAISGLLTEQGAHNFDQSGIRDWEYATRDSHYCAPREFLLKTDPDDWPADTWAMIANGMPGA